MTRQTPSKPAGSNVSAGGRGGAQLATPVPSGLIGRYQVLDKIGEGGMGSLFLARDPAIDRLVAIKVLRHGLDTEALRERFAREARAAGRLRHPHIVTIFDVGEHEGDPFIAMEFLAGETLAELIREGARLSLSRRLKLLEELCDGLAYAHRSGLVHRDIKPANLMVDADGVLKILDFGIVRVTDSGITQAGVLVGTVNYMSPEQVIGAAIDHRSDIFAVGLVAYELVSGKQAFSGTMKEGLLNKIINVAAEPLSVVVPGLDAEVVSIIDQALQKDPGDRYQDLVRMRNDLARARVRLDRDEEAAAAAAVAHEGETAVIGEHATIADEPHRSSSPAIVHDAEHALAAGNFRAALTLAGRSAAINPHDRAASSIAARAEAALLDRGRLLQSAAASSIQPASGEADLPSSAVPIETAGRRGMWMAVLAAVLATGVAVAALWFRQPASAPSPQIQPDMPASVQSAPESGSTPPPPTAAAPPGQVAAPPPPATSQPDQASAIPNGTMAPVPEAGPTEPPAGETRERPSRGRRGEPERRPAPATRPPLPPSPAPVSPAAAPAPTVVRVGVDDVVAPRVVNRVPPAYPPEAQAAGVEGRVDLELTIRPDGRVGDARVVRSVRGLDDAALAAARQWEFEPTQRNGQAVTVIYPVSVPFTLPEPARPAAAAATPTAAAPKPATPAPAPTAPPKAAEPSRPTPAPAADSSEDVRETLRRYKAAWEGLNPEALERVLTLSSSEAAAVRRFMASANRYQLEMTVQSIAVDPAGRSAVAQVAFVRRFDPKIGRAPDPQRSTSAVHLEKRGDGWVITRIQ